MSDFIGINHSLHFRAALEVNKPLENVNNALCARPVKTQLTTIEKGAVEALRKLAQNALYRDYMNEDYYLITFLKARDMNAQAANELLRQAHRWRIDNKIDNILKEDMTNLRKAFPYYNDAIDKEGRPVLTWDFGRWNIRRSVLAGSLPQLVRYLDRILEDATTLVREQRKDTGKDVTQYAMIIDGYGFNRRTHACVACMPFYSAFIKHTDQYYPNNGYRVYLINVPRIFDSVLEVIRPIMSQQIRDILKIYGFDSEEWKMEFSTHMDLNQLRKQFGGTKINNF